MTPKEKLKTLAEHNAEHWNYQVEMNSNRPQKNGISCPKCGKEMWDSSPMVTLTSFPTQKNVHCDCGYKGYRIA